MNSKQLTLYIIVILRVFQTIHSINIETLDLITAQPDEIAQAIKPHSIKPLATKALDTGPANIPLANLKELLADKPLAAKIVTRMNYINDITKENVHLFIQSIADNFDHINQHTLDWILHVKPNSISIETIIPLVVKQIKIINARTCVILLKMLELYPDAAEQFVQLTIDNFLTLSSDFYGQKLIFEILERYPSTALQFIQVILDHFLTLSQDYYGLNIIYTILELYPNAAQQFVQPAIDNTSILANDYYGKQLLTKLIEHNPQVQKSLDNYHFKSKVKSKIKEGLILTGTFMGSVAIGASFGYVTRYATVKFIIPAIKYLRTHTMGIIQ